MFYKKSTAKSMEASLAQLRRMLDAADTVVIGACAGLSTSAGFIYT
jgi:hypothetical protein